ncbi:hypothetical protein [Acidiphilium sp.]|uniref:hypothetical protein n=1 Tax=Acidiphilium sp. TaxID=527 RepID=UPI003D03E365
MGEEGKTAFFVKKAAKKLSFFRDCDGKTTGDPDWKKFFASFFQKRSACLTVPG